MEAIPEETNPRAAPWLPAHGPIRVERPGRTPLLERAVQPPPAPEFAAETDSVLERDGFEPSVPPDGWGHSEPVQPCAEPFFPRRDRKFEAGPLRGRAVYGRTCRCLGRSGSVRLSSATSCMFAPGSRPSAVGDRCRTAVTIHVAGLSPGSARTRLRRRDGSGRGAGRIELSQGLPSRGQAAARAGMGKISCVPQMPHRGGGSFVSQMHLCRGANGAGSASW